MSLSGELVLLMSSQLTVKPFSNVLGGGLCAGQDGQRNFPAFVSENKYIVCCAVAWGDKITLKLNFVDKTCDKFAQNYRIYLFGCRGIKKEVSHVK